ncbi:nuclear cap-binding protein subunit 3-like isoform X1 [Frieseomelitta varia]|uniref:nuclear cap-binding protein subunit 3-like isoform X1 n=1 Tax=Frieseomelitta varia TaxID=561572 RepID=UPI001CB69710|nr:nuclear cap-binding protein subunit 3-like isoform X1 [Frieseomelitta varia]
MDELGEPMEVEIVPVTDDVKNVDSEQTDVKPFNSNNMQVPEIQLDSRYENRGGTFMTGIDIFSKEEKLKMEERAKRFGLTEKLKINLSNQEQDLYSSMGIVEDSENTKNIRLNVIHMRGTEEMSTKDVFKYFEDYAPASIEWINDVSCNVVWLDNVSAARAMLGLSKKIVGLEKQRTTKSLDDNPDEENNVTNNDCTVEMDEDNEITKETDEDYINIKDINCPLPPGLWRKGIDYPKSKAIFLRFATRADKKQPNAEKMSEYYKKYGNPNFGGIKGILTESRKRMYKQIRQNKRKFKEESQDDVKDRKHAKNPWGALSESWGLNDAIESEFGTKNEPKDHGRSVKERLGIKYPPKETTYTEEQQNSSSSDSEDEWCKRSKVLRMRMHADDEEEKIHKRRAKLRQTMLNNLTRGNDLRSRLGISRKGTQFRDAIQVVVTNTSATNSNSLKLNDSEFEFYVLQEEDGEIIEDNESQEKEEGEWQASDEEEREEEDEDEDYSDEDSDKPAKEVQGPKGSVIKVVQHKPRVASTVWARLNNVKSEVIDNSIKDRQSRIRDLRSTLKGDLRSRIGNHTRGRSPLRIEVKNDKYAEGSETE